MILVIQNSGTYRHIVSDNDGILSYHKSWMASSNVISEFPFCIIQKLHLKFIQTKIHSRMTMILQSSNTFIPKQHFILKDKEQIFQGTWKWLYCQLLFTILMPRKVIIILGLASGAQIASWQLYFRIPLCYWEPNQSRNICYLRWLNTNRGKAFFQARDDRKKYYSMIAPKCLQE